MTHEEQVLNLMKLNQTIIDANLRKIADLENQIKSIKETNQHYALQNNEFMKELTK